MIVTVDVPVVAVLLAENVRALVPVVGLVPKVAVTPLGSAEVDKVTLPVKLFNLLTVIVSALLVLPCVAVKVLTDPDRLKSGAGGAFMTYMLEKFELSRPPVTYNTRGPTFVAGGVQLIVQDVLSTNERMI